MSYSKTRDTLEIELKKDTSCLKLMMMLEPQNLGQIQHQIKKQQLLVDIKLLKEEKENHQRAIQIQNQKAADADSGWEIQSRPERTVSPGEIGSDGVPKERLRNAKELVLDSAQIGMSLTFSEPQIKSVVDNVETDAKEEHIISQWPPIVE